MNITYIPDRDVEKNLDSQIINLLKLCFPYEQKFETRRYLNDKPAHRFCIIKEGMLIAHTAVHDKVCSFDGIQKSFSGIAEVCVAPDFRKQGITKNLLSAVENHFGEQDLFILLGMPLYYQSSGYEKVNNLYFTCSPADPSEGALVKTRKNFTWPASKKVIIAGLPF